MITARMNRIIMASRVVTDNFRNRRLVVRCYHATRLHLKKTALVVGSSGCLGSTVAKYLSREEHMNVIGADVVSPDADDSTLHDFVLLSPNSTLRELTENLAEGVEEGLSGESLSAIVVASGAWQMDPTPPITCRLVTRTGTNLWRRHGNHDENQFQSSSSSWIYCSCIYGTTR